MQKETILNNLNIGNSRQVAMHQLSMFQSAELYCIWYDKDCCSSPLSVIVPFLRC